MASIPYLLHSVSALRSVSTTASDFLVASIWQGLVIVGCAAVLLRLLPGLTAAARSAIWTAVLLLVVIFPGLPLFLHSGGGSTVAHKELLHAGYSWSLVLLSVWATVSMFRISQLVASAIRLQRIARRAVVVTPSDSIAALLRGSKRRIALCTSAEVDRPSVAGFFRPRILLAPGLLLSLSTSELEQVVLHEMEHLRRYDDWTNLLQKLSLALVPLHPVLLWLDRRMCLERELACDDRVLHQTRARKAYAACLTRLAEDSLVRRGFSLALGALGSRERTSELAGRVHRILRSPEEHMSRGKLWLATAALLAVVFAGAAGLARGPQLIGFSPAALPLARPQVASSARFVAASFHPVDRYGAFMAQPVMVKDVLSQRRVSSIRPVAVPIVERTAVARTAERRTMYRPRMVRATQRVVSRRPYFTVTSWRSTISSNTIPTDWTMTIAQDPQFLYAAVPMPDGWLIIQL